MPIKEAARSNARVYGRSLAGIVGLNTNQGRGCVLSGRGLCNGPNTCLEELLNECDWGTLKTPKPSRAAEPREKNHLHKKLIHLV